MSLEMRSIWGNDFTQNGSERLVALFVDEYNHTVAPLNPSIENIAEFTGLSENTVKKCLVSLFERDFLQLSKGMMDEKDNKYGGKNIMNRDLIGEEKK